MTRRDILQCVHEPFGDAFYYGPERLSARYEENEQNRIDSGFQNTTYQTVLDRLDREGAEVRFILPNPVTSPLQLFFLLRSSSVTNAYFYPVSRFYLFEIFVLAVVGILPSHGTRKFLPYAFYYLHLSFSVWV